MKKLFNLSAPMQACSNIELGEGGGGVRGTSSHHCVKIIVHDKINEYAPFRIKNLRLVGNAGNVNKIALFYRS